LLISPLEQFQKMKLSLSILLFLLQNKTSRCLSNDLVH
jgi:hypothetical protein